MNRTRYTKEIWHAACTHSLDPDIVEGLVIVESAGNTDAFRFEPKFWSRYLAKKDEWKHWNPRRASSSYGLMQIMYPTATDRGFQGVPEELFVPEVGLDWGCRHLAFLMAWGEAFRDRLPKQSPADTILRAVLASYNGGRGGNTPGIDLRTGYFARHVLSVVGKPKESHDQSHRA